MRASVVIPTCNKHQDLRRCLEAVLAQEFSGFEVLVCDDGSQDRTAAMLRDWQVSEPRLRYFRQEQRGPAAARNLGIRHAEGDVVAMTDDDTIRSRVGSSDWWPRLPGPAPAELKDG